MAEFKMLTVTGGEKVQVFPLIPGRVNIAAADGAKPVKMIYCVVAGDITVAWAGGETPATVAIVEGETFSFPDGAVVTAGTGTVFHYV